MSNTWNKFQQQYAGSGLTKVQVSQLYRQRQFGGQTPEWKKQLQAKKNEKTAAKRAELAQKWEKIPNFKRGNRTFEQFVTQHGGQTPEWKKQLQAKKNEKTAAKRAELAQKWEKIPNFKRGNRTFEQFVDEELMK
jgi:hypothetical protein